ncbi:hypothetical protein [Nitriliruptor alkaliphilus]|uniref:hypothetical protein n=1 Tax=Nitriliruptor alkaliphilus TaxID=427918 RepID=UPI000696A4B6|nr:hypothetical protein [Nitriliruptor alkaliphilus]
MNLTTNEIIVIAVAVVAVLAIVAAIVLFLVRRRRRRRRAELKQRHGGADYARAVDRAGSERRAEEQLSDRKARREALDLRPLSSGERSTFRARFEAIETSFVDAPEAAVRSADSLLDEVAECRGYPEVPAEQRLQDLSADHPAAVDRYRTSRARPDQEGSSPTTEQHRQALLGSRVLFTALVGRDPAEQAEAPPSFRDLVDDRDPAEHEHRDNGHRRHEPSHH